MADSFTPDSYLFTHKLYGPTQNPLAVVFATVGFGISETNKSINNLPPWLEIYNKVFPSDPNIREWNFSLRINESYANGMAPGVYTRFVKARAGGYDYPTTFISDSSMRLSIEIIDTTLLSVSPTSIPFGNYTIGSNPPQGKMLQIESESNWFVTSSQDWVSFSSSTGSENGQVVVNVDPSGLTPGSYDAIVTVTDNYFAKEVVVTITVSEEDTSSQYLYVAPQNFEFVSEFESGNSDELFFNLDASKSWTSVYNSWIVLSQDSGNAGSNDLTVGVDSVALAIGSYNGVVTFTSGNIVKKIYVNLEVVGSYVDGLESEAFYFADDRNELKISSSSSNNWLLLDSVASTGSKNVPYSHEAPYFQGFAKIIFGLETNNLISLVYPGNSLLSRIQNNIKPININVTAFNINKFTNAVSQIGQFNNMLFIKGKTPIVTNKLCYIPSDVVLTNKSVLSLTVFSGDAAPGGIVISGDVDAVISSGISNSLYVYNAIVNLDGLGLIPGNSIAITFGNLVVNVFIKQNEPEETIIAFENEWGEIEFFNCTGVFTRTSIITDLTTEIAQEGKELTQIVTIDSGCNYVLNTGFIYSQEEVDWLAKMLDSKRKFIYLDGSFIQVYFTTKKLEVYETRRTTHSFNLKFKKALV